MNAKMNTIGILYFQMKIEYISIYFKYIVIEQIN